MTTSYKYFAFISYSRKNSRVASFVKKRLEHFRVPLKYVAVENRPADGRFVRPVFRDTSNLSVTSESFTVDIRAALDGSRYLLVLCSPESAQSEWVNKEIEYFLDHHNNDVRKIVPIILEGNPGDGSDMDCLPRALRDTTLERRGIPEVLPDGSCGRMTGRNLPTMIPDEGAKEIDGWENGVIQTLSYLLKVNRESVKASIDAERVRQMKIYAIIAAVCTCIFAGLAFWAVKAERRADANRKIAEANEVRAVAGEKEAIHQREKAEENWRVAETNRVKAETNWRVAEANRVKAEDNERRAVAGEKLADEKRELAEKTLDFVKRMLQEAKPDEHGPKNVVDLLTEQVSKIDLLQPDELKYAVAIVVGQIMMEQSMFKPAESLLKSAVQYSRKVDNRRTLYVASHLLATLYKNTGRKRESIDLMIALTGMKINNEMTKNELARLYYDMAYVSRGMFKYQDVLHQCTNSLEIAQSDLNGAKIKADVYWLMATMALDRQDYSGAETMLRRAEEVIAAAGGKITDTMIETRSRILIGQKKYAEAKTLVEKCINNEIRRAGRQSINTFRGVTTIGVLEYKLGNKEKALTHFENAIQIMQGLFPAGHPELGTAYSNLGGVLKELKSYIRAKQCLQTALSMIERTDGEKSTKIIDVLFNLADMAEFVDLDYPTACRHLDRIISIAINVYGENCIQILNARRALGRISLKNNNVSDSMIFFEDALRICDGGVKIDEAMRADLLNEYASTLLAAGMYSNAVETVDAACDLVNRGLNRGVQSHILRNRERILADVRLGLRQHPSRSTSSIVKDGTAVLVEEASNALDTGLYDKAEELYSLLQKKLINDGFAFSTTYALACNQQGVIAYRNGKYVEALSYQMKAKDINERIYGSNNVEVAVNYGNIGDTLFAMKDYFGARKSYDAAIRIHSRLTTGQNETMSSLYTRIGRAFKESGHYDKAITNYEKAKNADMELHGTNCLAVAVDYEDIGDALIAFGSSRADTQRLNCRSMSLAGTVTNANKLVKEADLYRLAVTNYLAALVLQEALQESKPRQSYLNNQLGVTYYKLQDYKSALERTRRAFELDCELHGLTNRETAVALGNMGDLERRCGDATNAVAHLRESIELRLAVGGFSRQSLAITWNDLGLACLDAGDYKGAIDAYQKALDLDLKEFGREHREVMTVRGNMAVAYRKLGRNQEEGDCLRAALDVAKLLYDEADPDVLERYRQMTDYLHRMKKWEKCIMMRKKILEIVRNANGNEDMSVAQALNLLGQAQYRNGDYDEASQSYRESVRIYALGGEEFRESVAVVSSNLGFSEMQSGNNAAALRAFEQASQIVREEGISVVKDSDLASVDRQIAKCRVRINAWPIVRISKVESGNEGDKLGLMVGDIWYSIGHWNARDSKTQRRDLFWKAAQSEWQALNSTNRTFTVIRKINGGWNRVSLELRTPDVGFSYELSDMPKDEFDAAMD